jgi:aspartate carbamoyltransferase catalytic subunit
LQKEFTSLEEGIYNVDVIYMTRIQEERFASKEAFENVKGKFILTPKILRNAVASQLDEELEFCATPGKFII